MIVADFLLLGVEAYTLTDDCRFRACGAPDSKWHLKAYGEDTLSRLAGTGAESMPEYEICELRHVYIKHKSLTHLPASLLAEVVPSCSGGT